jgi:Fur family ferric uptake transcriptional regulator
MHPDLHEISAQRLASDGQRYTRNRQAIVAILGEAARPLALSEVLSVGDDLAQSSVYRNLVVLEDAGVVRKVVATDEFARYELAEDLTEHHHHLLCSGCGAVEDFVLPARVERSVENALAAVAAEAGFVGGHHRLDLVGRCARCAPAAPVQQARDGSVPRSPRRRSRETSS